MPGLIPIAGSDLVFDKPEGRIVEAQAQGASSRAKVQAFYAASLPQLGWRSRRPIGGSAMPSDCGSISAGADGASHRRLH